MDRQRTIHRPGHTLIELVTAMVASGVLMVGLAAVMLIGRQIAYTPSASVRRIEASRILNDLSAELRFATFIVAHTQNAVEFVVADRDGDGAAEKIRYEWSGTAGEPLRKTISSGTSVGVLESVDAFATTLQLKSKATTLKTTTESAEAVLQANTSVVNNAERDVRDTIYHAQQVNPALFASIPANAITWNATKVEFYGLKSGPANETLLIQLRTSGEPNDAPTSNVLGQVSVPESYLAVGAAWHTIVFPSPTRDLALHRKYDLVWTGIGGAPAAKLVTNELASGGVLESSDAGASWQFMTTRQMFYRLYGTYTTPGTSYNVTRNYVSHVGLVVQSGEQAHSRIDASVPLINLPELLSAYWRTDFSTDPTVTDETGDGVADWQTTGGGPFDPDTLVDGVWHPGGALETRPYNDFPTPTTVEVRCRNTTIGGNGAVVRINADHQGGLHAPLIVGLTLQTDGTQTLTLYGKSSDAANVQLFQRKYLSANFVRFRLTILPSDDLVNLSIEDEDQGTFSYPRYAPSSDNRYLTLYTDTSSSEFDYVELRVSEN